MSLLMKFHNSEDGSDSEDGIDNDQDGIITPAPVNIIVYLRTGAVNPLDFTMEYTGPVSALTVCLNLYHRVPRVSQHWRGQDLHLRWIPRDVDLKNLQWNWGANLDRDRFITEDVRLELMLIRQDGNNEALEALFGYSITSWKPLLVYLEKSDL